MNTALQISEPVKGGALRQALSSRLIQKGLVIIAIPVMFSTSFITALKLLLDETQAQADREARSRQILLSGGALGGALSMVVANSYASRMLGLSDANKIVEKDVAASRQCYKELQASVIPGTHEAKLVDRIGKNLELALAITNEGRQHEQGKESLREIGMRRYQMQTLLQGFLRDANALSEAEERKSKAFPVTEQGLVRLIDILLYGGIAFELILAFGLMIYFSTSITGRLSTLMDNADRLVQEKDLNRLVKGDDEIAQLDSVFHDVADKLDESRAIERGILTRLQAIIETIPLGIAIVDQGGNVVSLSPSAEKMFGYESQECAGKSLDDLFKLPSSKTAAEVLEELSHRSNMLAVAFEAKRTDGSHFPSEVLSTEYNTTDTSGRLLVISDVTERYEVEKLKQSFVSMVSHELRSPLTSLQFCFTMLARGHFGEVNEDGRKKVDMAEKNVKRLISLVNEILDAERLESGQLSIDRAPGSLQEVFDMAAGSVSAMAEKAGVKIKVESTAVELDIDKNRLVQVVVNLLSNAVKFSPESSTITVYAQESAGKTTVNVTDQGRGIPPEHLDLIFKRFHQVKRTDASEKGGTGLGLAISKAIVEGHGGEIGVTSTVGEGSTFWFSLPMPDAGT